MKPKKIITYFLVVCCVLLNVTSVSAKDKILQKQPLVSPYYTAGLPVDSSFAEQGVSPFAIIDEDERYVVKNTTVFPYSAVCSLVVRFPGDKQKSVTGFMVAENIVLTAGHCLYSDGFLDNKVRLADYVHVYPGRQGNKFPFEPAIADQDDFNIHPNWLKSMDKNYDMASIFLDEPIGYECGWFGYDANIGSTSGEPIRISGYPDGYGYQVYRSIGSVTFWRSTQMLYRNDTEPGDSGAPVYGRYSPYTVLGIHLGNQNSESNRGRPITTYEALNFLLNGEVEGFFPVDPGGGFEPEPGGGDFDREPIT